MGTSRDDPLGEAGRRLVAGPLRRACDRKRLACVRGRHAQMALGGERGRASEGARSAGHRATALAARRAADDYWTRWLEVAALKPDVERLAFCGVSAAAEPPQKTRAESSGRSLRLVMFGVARKRAAPSLQVERRRAAPRRARHDLRRAGDAVTSAADRLLLGLAGSPGGGLRGLGGGGPCGLRARSAGL